jgi:transmembrane sensor
MKKHYDNIEKESEAFFSKAKVAYSATKEEAWDQMMAKPGQKNTQREYGKIIKLNFTKMAVAASIAVLIGLGFFFKLYTTTLSVMQGERLAYALPDGSVVNMNSASSLTYHPYWWKVERTMEFEGEAFFEVKKGSNFSVVSPKGITEVLGTSFNISTRNNDYQVYCLTGKVRVSEVDGNRKAILTPNMYTSISKEFEVVENVKQDDAIAWKLGYFNFKQQQLKEVLAAFEMQYGISIKSTVGLDTLVYTGFFKMPSKPSDALNLICKSFGISFEKEQNNYLIYQSN